MCNQTSTYQLPNTVNVLSIKSRELNQSQNWCKKLKFWVFGIDGSSPLDGTLASTQKGHCSEDLVRRNYKLSPEIHFCFVFIIYTERAAVFIATLKGAVL
jgi:hypothetical protein